MLVARFKRLELLSNRLKKLERAVDRSPDQEEDDD
jgi:hypothetical protein